MYMQYAPQTIHLLSSIAVCMNMDTVIMLPVPQVLR